MIYTSKKIIIFLFTIMQLAILASCMDSGYRLSFPEIDDLADEYPAQAKVFLSRADSNDNKGYYKLLTAKIEYQLNGYIYKENDIDDAINIFVNEKDEPLLARSLYYKGASILNNYRDTAKAIKWFAKAIAYDSNMREKEKLDMYDILCRITHQNIYTVELEDEARQTNNIRYRAWALLYRGINNQDQELANQAFEVANQIKENKDSTLGPMYYHYFQALMDRGDVPDSILISYAKKAQDNHGVKYDNNIDFYRLLTRNSEETHAFATQHIKENYSIDQERLNSWGSYSFALGYKYYLPLYFLSLQKGDTLMANRVAHELRQEAPLLVKDENSEKENQVKLMYEGGNTRYRYEKVKTYIFVGIIIVLIILLTMTYLSISRIRKAHQTIKNGKFSIKVQKSEGFQA
jgi:tetratricopeptide (TPR) repeat protein